MLLVGIPPVLGNSSLFLTLSLSPLDSIDLLGVLVFVCWPGFVPSAGLFPSSGLLCSPGLLSLFSSSITAFIALISLSVIRSISSCLTSSLLITKFIIFLASSRDSINSFLISA